MPDAFELPNTLVAGTAEDIRDVQGNFEAIRDRINSGLVDRPVPSAECYGQPVIAMGALHTGGLTIESWDTGGMYDPEVIDRLTVVLAGFYVVVGSVDRANVGAGNEGWWESYLVQERGGVEVNATSATNRVDGGESAIHAINVTAIFRAEAGDIFRWKNFNRTNQSPQVTSRLRAIWQSPLA